MCLRTGKSGHMDMLYLIGNETETISNVELKIHTNGGNSIMLKITQSIGNK